MSIGYPGYGSCTIPMETTGSFLSWNIRGNVVNDLNCPKTGNGTSAGTLLGGPFLIVVSHTHLVLERRPTKIRILTKELVSSVRRTDFTGK